METVPFHEGKLCDSIKLTNHNIAACLSISIFGRSNCSLIYVYYTSQQLLFFVDCRLLFHQTEQNLANIVTAQVSSLPSGCSLGVIVLTDMRS